MFLIFSFAVLALLYGCTSKKSLDEIQKRGDLYYLKNSDNPFSGLLYADYAKDTNWFKKEIKKGMIDGKVEIWYRSKQKKYEFEYKENKPNGIALGWYDNGVQWFKGSLKDGNLDGLIEVKNEQNQIILQSNYINGKRNDKWIEYYSNGKTKNEGVFKDDLPIGKWIFYKDDGSKLLEGYYANGKRIGKWLVYSEDCAAPVYLTFVNDYPILDSWSFYNVTDKCKKILLKQILRTGMQMIIKNLLPEFLSKESNSIYFYAFNQDSLRISTISNSVYKEKYFNGNQINTTPSNGLKITFFYGGFEKDQADKITQEVMPEKENSYQKTIAIISDFKDTQEKHEWNDEASIIFGKPVIYSFSENAPLIDTNSFSKNIPLRYESLTDIDHICVQKSTIEIISDKEVTKPSDTDNENIEKITDCNIFLTKYEAFVMKYADMVIKYQQNQNNVDLYTETLTLYMDAQKWIGRAEECAKDPAFASKVAELNMKLIEKMQEAQKIRK